MVAASALPSPPRHRWLGLAVLSLGVSMIIVDATVVTVAIPTIIGDLGLRATDAEWMNTIYSLVFAALLISVGRAGDRESAGAVLPALRQQPGGEAVAEVVEGAFVASARLVTAVGAGFILAGLVAAARLPKEKPASRDEDRAASSALRASRGEDGTGKPSRSLRRVTPRDDRHGLPNLD